MSLSELREVVGGERKTVLRGLRRLESQKLLEYVASDDPHIGRGHPAGLWTLTPRGRNEARQVTQAAAGTLEHESDDVHGDEEHDRSVILGEGFRWVTAVVPPEFRTELEAALADGELTAAASSISRLDGDGPHYLFAFGPAVGDQPTRNLVAALTALGAVCESGTIRAVRRPAEFVESLRTAHAAGTRALQHRQG